MHGSRQGWPDEPPQIDLRDVIDVVRRQSRVVAYCFALVATAAALLLAVAPGRYEATALLMIDPTGSDGLSDQQTANVNGAAESARVDSQVEILRSDALALAVINRLALTHDEEFTKTRSLPSSVAGLLGRTRALGPLPEPSASADTIRKLKKAITVQRRGLTYVIALTASSRDPGKSASLANTMAQSFIEAQLSRNVREHLAARDAVAVQLELARGQLDELERRYDHLLDDGIISLKDQVGTAQAAIVEQLAALRAETEKHLIMTVQAQDNQATGSRAASLGPGAQIRRDPFGSDQSLSASDGAMLPISFIDAIPAGSPDQDKELARLESRAADIRDALRQTMPFHLLAPRMLRELATVGKDIEAARSHRDMLLVRMRDIETKAETQLPGASLVSPAVVPLRASFPDPATVVLLALALALPMGFGAAFLNEHLLGGVTSESQLAGLPDAPVVVEIPDVNELLSGRTSSADRIVDSPLSSYSESFRKLRTALDRRFRETGPARGRLILVTSSIAGEGKTTSALALARSYALAGQKTLLIDGDLRNPSIHRQIGFQPERGLAEYLRNRGADRGRHEFYARDPISPLALILGARPSLDVTDTLLSGGAFMGILNQARDVYDITIIDTPPVLPVVDAVHVAEQVDAAVLTVKWASTRSSDAGNAARQLNASLGKGAFTCSVLTQSRSGKATGPGYSQYFSNHSAAI